MGKVIVMRGDSKLSKLIQKYSKGEWSHCGYMISDDGYIDFCHNYKRITTIDEIERDERVTDYAILDDGQDFWDGHIASGMMIHYRNAIYAKKGVVNLAKKIKSGRDDENIHPQYCATYPMHCASLMMYEYTRPRGPGLIKTIDFPYHYSQATPSDFYDYFEVLLEREK